MRRAPIVLAATVAGFAGVMSFHTSKTTVALGGGSTSTGSASAATGRATSSSGAGSGTSASGATTGGGGSGASSTATPSGPVNPSSSGGQARPSSSPSSQGAGGAATSGGASTPARTATGKAENFGYGVLSVKVTVSGGRIQSVKVASLQLADPASQYYCGQAIPMLTSEVLKAQSTKIYAISGATFVSEAYAYSLQSALHKLHFA